MILILDCCISHFQCISLSWHRAWTYHIDRGLCTLLRGHQAWSSYVALGLFTKDTRRLTWSAHLGSVLHIVESTSTVESVHCMWLVHISKRCRQWIACTYHVLQTTVFNIRHCMPTLPLALHNSQSTSGMAFLHRLWSAKYGQLASTCPSCNVFYYT